MWTMKTDEFVVVAVVDLIEVPRMMMKWNIAVGDYNMYSL
jgi:hypothetical protein